MFVLYSSVEVDEVFDSFLSASLSSQQEVWELQEMTGRTKIGNHHHHHTTNYSLSYSLHKQDMSIAAVTKCIK